MNLKAKSTIKPINYGSQTTVITGASSGIGAEFARALAKRGSNLVLVARRLDRLQQLAAELEAAHGIRAYPVALDLSLPGAGQALTTAVSDLGLTVTSLINNAGFGTDGFFHDEDAHRLGEEINVDVANLVDITRAFIGPLRTAGSGILINVASMAAYNPTPGMAVYAACKAFVLNFTEALWHESRSTGLRVIALSPGATKTEFFEVLGGETYDTKLQTPQQVVAVALRSLDRGNKRPSITTTRVNGVLTYVGRLFSRRRTVLVVASIAASAASVAKRTPATLAG